MSELTSTIEQHTAGPQAIGFDYQFYYFMFLALELKLGQKIGFEVKDDVHIDKEDGTAVLLQTKHSVVVNSTGKTQNLSSLDADLWKTLSTWVGFIKADRDSGKFLTSHSFILVTNKNNNKNPFIKSIELLKSDNDVDKLWNELVALEAKTEDATIKMYIKNVKSIGKRKLKLFASKLTIETGVDLIIQKIKNRILETVKQHKLVDPIFESLSSNLQVAKYTAIRERKKFEITCDEFNKKFGKCFQVAFETKPLPSRNLPILLPDNLEEQLFVKQLIDIGEVISGSTDIRDYTTQMLKFLNDFTYWSAENYLLPIEVENFMQDSLLRWKNEFKAKYRAIQDKVTAGESVNSLESDIKSLGIELVDFIRGQNLTIAGHSPLGIPSSNGHYYAMSDNLKIGWHFDWKNKYNKR
ncbi:MAG TPA: hypothetical protein VLC98_12625 [Phnomibacter sp.]|nr:hypothetical protein [Phnomibacter sp.]